MHDTLYIVPLLTHKEFIALTMFCNGHVNLIVDESGAATAVARNDLTKSVNVNKSVYNEALTFAQRRLKSDSLAFGMVYF